MKLLEKPHKKAEIQRKGLKREKDDLQQGNVYKKRKDSGQM